MREELKSKIIYEDNNLLALNKPSGLVVHPFDYSTELTLVDFLQEDYPTMFSIENSILLQDKRTIDLGGIVHKLDRDTSGVMVIAKNQNIFEELKAQFRNHLTNKIYVALVEGVVTLDSFIIDAPLGRGKKDYKQSTNPLNPRGEMREALTEVEVLKRGLKTSLVKLYPKTGRTHQLRAHMASVGHPIVGDKTYGSLMDSTRIMLHAQSLNFKLDGQDYNFETALPEEFGA